MQLHGLIINDDRLAAVCRTFGVREVLLFGSITRDDFGPDSDVDVIVRFLPGRGPGLIGFAGMQLQLGEIVGRPVHLHTDAMIHPYFRKQILDSARVAYAA